MGTVTLGIPELAVVLLVATGLRIAELLALEIGKHISRDCTVIYVRQQRSRKGEIVQTPKTDAGFRDVDVHPLVATMLREYIGNRKSGFLLETGTGKMLWPASFIEMSQDHFERDGAEQSSFPRLP